MLSTLLHFRLACLPSPVSSLDLDSLSQHFSCFHICTRHCAPCDHSNIFSFLQTPVQLVYDTTQSVAGSISWRLFLFHFSSYSPFMCRIPCVILSSSMCINTPVSGLSKGQAIAAPSSLLLSCVLVCATKCKPAVPQLSFCVSFHALFPSSYLTSSLLPCLCQHPIFDINIIIILDNLLIVANIRDLHDHLSLSTPQNVSQHRCQHTDIYTSPVFLICVFLLVGNVASSFLTPSHLGIYLNSTCRHHSTLQTGAHCKGLVVFLSDTNPSWTVTSFKLAV